MTPVDAGPDDVRAVAMPVRGRGPQVLTSALSIALCLIALGFALEVHLMFGLVLFTEQALVAILGFALGIIFLTVPAHRRAPTDRVPVYDMALSVIGIAATAYLAVRYPSIAENLFLNLDEAFLVGIVVLPLTIEALRRTSGWSLVCVLGAFLTYGFFGHLVPGRLQGRSQEVVDLVAYLGIDSTAMFGVPMTIICTMVIAFIFMGQLLLRSGASEWFTDIATALMGQSRGGSAKIAVVASGLFGSISGSATANVASTGVITIPLMRRAGFDAKTAAAFEAVASTGGQILPPIMGAAAFVMAEFLEIAYVQVILAALIPGLLYYVSVFVQADLEAARKNIAPIPVELIPPLGRVLKEGWFFVLPFVVLILALFSLNRSPEESALWSAFSIIAVSWVLGYKGKRLSPKDLYLSLRDTGRLATDIVVIGGVAGLIIGVLEVTGLGFGLTFILVQLGEGSLIALLMLTALICIVLGMGMPTTAIYLLVATLAAPPLVQLGIEPLAAHLFVLYFGIVSLITPPVAVAAFVAANLAGAKPMETALTSVRFGWTALVVPFMFVASPSLIMQGRAIDIVLAFVTAVIGVWLASAGLMGFFMRRLTPIMRLGFTIAGLALIVPADASPSLLWLEIGGALLAALVVGREVIAERTLKAGIKF